MPRSLKKGPFVHKSLLKKVQVNLDSNKKSVIKTWSRSSMNNLGGSAFTAPSWAVMHHDLSCGPIGRHSAASALHSGHSKRPFQSGGVPTLPHRGNTDSMPYCHPTRAQFIHASLAWAFSAQATRRSTHLPLATNSFRGGRTAPFDHSLSSNVFSAKDRRAPAGRWTFEAS